MKNSARGFSSLILILLVVVLVAGGAYFFLNQDNTVNGNSAQQTASVSTSYAVNTGFTGDLTSLFQSLTNWFQLHSSSTPVNILPVPLGYTETHFGIAASFPLAQHAAQALGVHYARAGLLPTSNPRYQTYIQKVVADESAGINVLAEYDNIPANPPLNKQGQPVAAPVTDINAYTASFSTALDATHPAFITIGIEENGGSDLTSETPEQYLQELTLATQIAHAKGYKISNGGISNGALDIAYWDDLWTSGQHAAADAFAQQAFAPGLIGGHVPVIGDIPDSNNPDRPILANDPVRALQLKNAQILIAGYKATGIDYINFHWFGDPPATKAAAVAWLEQKTDLTAMSNAIGVESQNAILVTNALSETVALHLPYAIWFSSAGAGGDTNAPLVDLSSGALLTNGLAFKTFIASHTAGQINSKPILPGASGYSSGKPNTSTP